MCLEVKMQYALCNMENAMQYVMCARCPDRLKSINKVQVMRAFKASKEETRGQQERYG